MISIWLITVESLYKSREAWLMLCPLSGKATEQSKVVPSLGIPI